MNKGRKLYNSLIEKGINPFSQFTGDEYNILIPLNDLERFSYTPSYENEYKKLGIMDMTYAVNPNMYVCLYILNKLAKILDVRFRVMEAWRPFEIQLQKYNEEQIKNPGSTLFIKPEKNKGLPHVCGGAVDLLITNGYGEPLTQPKWLLRKDPELLKQIKHLNHDFDNVNNPFFTNHIQPLDNADKNLKLSSINVDYMRNIVSSILNLRHINDENWHFQLSDKDTEYLPSYKNISISDVKNTSIGHVDRIKKEMSDFAESVFGVFYNRPFQKGVKHNFTIYEFDEKDIISFEDLKQKLNNYIIAQQKIISK